MKASERSLEGLFGVVKRAQPSTVPRDMELVIPVDMLCPWWDQNTVKWLSHRSILARNKGFNE